MSEIQVPKVGSVWKGPFDQPRQVVSATVFVGTRDWRIRWRHPDKPTAKPIACWLATWDAWVRRAEAKEVKQ